MDDECPLCLEALDIDDRNFFPCTCGYQICRFCWHRIRVNENGLCPACRKPYPENPANFKPLSVEELQKMKAQKRQKEQMKKQKTVDNRRHLADLRVVQKNLVFVVGIAQRIADPEMLKKPEYFGKFGKIQKVVVNPCLQGSSAGAYITYYKSEDALRAIQSVNNVPFDGRTIKASLGTTKYCSHFMRNQQCPKAECMYLHHYGDQEASFTKEDMQLGKHQEYEKKLIDDFLQAAGAVNIKKPAKQRTISGGSVGEISSSAMTPSNSFKESNIWNNGTANSANSYNGVDEGIINPTEPEIVEEEPKEEEEEQTIDECGNTNNIPDDDLGFDPFHETQKAFEELIQEESQRVHHYPTNTFTNQRIHGHQIQGHHAQIHSLLHHPSVVPQQPPQNPGSNNIFPRTLLPPPGFNTHLNQQTPQQHPQSAPTTNHHLHWTSSNSVALNHHHHHHHHHVNHVNHHQYEPPITLKEMEDWMSLDPAIIFSSNHLRQQPTLGQQTQPAPPGFPSINGQHIKTTHPHY